VPGRRSAARGAAAVSFPHSAAQKRRTSRGPGPWHSANLARRLVPSTLTTLNHTFHRPRLGKMGLDSRQAKGNERVPMANGTTRPGEPRGLRPQTDTLLQEITDYTLTARIESAEAWETARYCLLDALGCGLLALGYPACSNLIGPIVPGASLPGGARLPGTSHELDPVPAAFCIVAIVRLLAFQDTSLAAAREHPCGD